MSNRTIPVTDRLYAYLSEECIVEPDVLRRLREETAQHPESQMQIAPEQGQFMAMLVRLMNVRRALEIGVFTGYSSTAVALALPTGGRLIALDVSDEYTRVARRVWEDAGVADRIELRLGIAADLLEDLRREGEEGHFDFAFIDADKEGYLEYYELVLPLLREGGLMLFDNMFRGGRVADDEDLTPATLTIRALNRRMMQDPRVDVCTVPIADGLALARKRVT